MYLYQGVCSIRVIVIAPEVSRCLSHFINPCIIQATTCSAGECGRGFANDYSQNIFVKVCIAGVEDCLKTSLCPLSQVQCWVGFATLFCTKGSVLERWLGGWVQWCSASAGIAQWLEVLSMQIACSASAGTCPPPASLAWSELMDF